VADHVFRQSLVPGAVILISADVRGEGGLVSELAMRRPPHLFAVRASKVLVSQRLMGHDYQPLYNTPEELMSLIDSIPVAVLVLESTATISQPHEVLLHRTIAQMPSRWQLINVTGDENGRSIRLYKVTGNEHKSMEHLEINMEPTLGTSIAHESTEHDRCVLSSATQRR
jgi:hypothetical protein